jgi:hypothetical protein
MTRIIGSDGNVIAADFRPKTDLLTVQIKTETLYYDDRILVTRATATVGGQIVVIRHLLADIHTGAIVTL